MRISPEEALQRIADGRKKAKGKSFAHVMSWGITDASLYVFQRGRETIICPADDGLRPTLASLDADNFGDDMPPSLEEWLTEYSREIEWYTYHSVGDDAEEETREDVAPMLKTAWSQDAPFNNHLNFGDGVCKVGCAAVAAGQIMYYWGGRYYHRGCKAVTAYTTFSNHYKVGGLEPIKVFDYPHLSAKKPSGEKGIEAVATLLEYLGKSFRSDYTRGGTGATPKDVATSLKTNFRMGSNIRMVFASKGAEAFEDAIYSDISQGRPAIVCGYTASGGGHAFVCDGYKFGKYHFNWGWGGAYNGYFAMSALNPMAGKMYNSNKIAIVGIQPDYRLGDVNGDGEINVTDVMSVARQMVAGEMMEAADVNSDGKVTDDDVKAIVNHILGKDGL